jgi:hypothetical protein
VRAESSGHSSIAEIDLTHALETVIGRGMGTFLSCIPGKLAYFEDEDCRWILERRS